MIHFAKATGSTADPGTSRDSGSYRPDKSKHRNKCDLVSHVSVPPVLRVAAPGIISTVPSLRQGRPGALSRAASTRWPLAAELPERMMSLQVNCDYVLLECCNGNRLQIIHT